MFKYLHLLSIHSDICVQKKIHQKKEKISTIFGADTKSEFIASKLEAILMSYLQQFNYT